MKSEELLNLIGEVQDEYILDAKTSVNKKTSSWAKWVTMAACLCIVMLGAFQLFGDQGSTFALTAYALSEDDSLLSFEMKEGKSVSISTFVADNGMEGFVFSHKNRDSEKTPFVSIIDTNFSPYIMTDSYTSTTTVENIENMDLRKTQQYIFVVPSAGEVAPYSLTISIYDEKTSTYANITIVIDGDGSAYSAKIDKVNSYEIIGNIDELLKPYQEVLDRVNEAYDRKLYIPDDRKYSVYDAYKDLSPEEFEKQILEEINGVDEDFEGNGEINFDIVFLTPQ